MIRHVASPSGLSQTLLVGGDLLVPCSLPGPPVIEKLTQMITRVLGQVDWFQSMGFPYHQGVIVTSAHFFTKTLQSEESSLYPGERSIFISEDRHKKHTDRPCKFPQFTTMTSTPYPALFLPNLHPMPSLASVPRSVSLSFSFLMKTPISHKKCIR